MQLSKERKIFVGVLLLALGALFVDRVVIGSDVTEPQRASAGQASAPARTGEPPAAASVANTPQSPPQGPSIADRLREVTQARGSARGDVRDALAPSKAWADELGLGQSDTTVQQEIPFQDRHHLVAAVVIDGDRYVIIDDQTLGLGNTLDGYTLVDVNERTAVLESNGHRVELEIPSEM